MLEYDVTLDEGLEKTIEIIEETAKNIVELEEDALLKVTEVADYLRVDSTTVRRYITNGLINAVVLPHNRKRASYRIRKSELTRILATPVAL